ncbi:MAG: DMT family transporter [Bacteroidales bacterium]|nr:DMT family transporter [Bacteroidales bacterium]
MIFLVLSIISSTIIAVTFKLQSKFNVKLFPVIVINYFMATFWGLLLTDTKISINQIISSKWIFSAIIIGALLILGFYLIGFSTQKIGVAITTISNKMSVVLPMIFSILYFKEPMSATKAVGIIIALIAVFLSVYRKRNKEIDIKFIYLPFFLFAAIGLIDATLKFAQENLSETEISIFTAISFGISGIIGVILSFFGSIKFKDFIKIKTLITGIIVGSANFGSMYFMIFALNKSGLDSSAVFGINNIAIITISVLLAFFIFKEKLKLIKWVGVFASIFAILLLMFYS